MVLHFMFLFHVLFCDLLRLFRCRIQFIENIGRKLFSQHRSVGDDAVVMVNESHAIDSADRVDDLLRLGVLHGLDDVTSVPQLRVRVLVLASLPGLDLGHGLVVGLLAENDLSDRDSAHCIHYLKSQRIMLYFTRPQ